MTTSKLKRKLTNCCIPKQRLKTNTKVYLWSTISKSKSMKLGVFYTYASKSVDMTTKILHFMVIFPFMVSKHQKHHRKALFLTMVTACVLLNDFFFAVLLLIN